MDQSQDYLLISQPKTKKLNIFSFLSNFYEKTLRLLHIRKIYFFMSFRVTDYFFNDLVEICQLDFLSVFFARIQI